MKTNARRHAVMALGVALAGGALVLGCGPYSGFWADNGTHAHRGFPFTGPALTIVVTDAGLAVEAGGGGEVAADRWTTGSARPTWSLSGSTLTLGSSCPGVVAGSCGTRFQIKTPSGVAVAVRSDRGDVVVTGLAEPLTLHSTHGDAVVEGTSGRLDLTNQSGDLTVANSHSAHVAASTTGGDASYSFAAPPSAVSVSVTSGDLHVTLPAGSDTYRITSSASRGTSSSRISSDPASPRSIAASASGGDVSITRA